MHGQADCPEGLRPGCPDGVYSRSGGAPASGRGFIEPRDPKELEEDECDKPDCTKQKELLRMQVSDLNKQVDTLSEMLRMVTRRCCILKRRSTSLGSARIGQVAQRLLSSLGPDEEECAPAEQPPALPDTSEEKPSTSQQPQEEDQPHYPDHVAVLNEIMEEYRQHREGPDPGTKLKESVGCQVYRIKKFLVHVEGKEESARLPLPQGYCQDTQLGQLPPTSKDDSDDYPALCAERRLLHPVPLGNPPAVLPPVQESPGRPTQGDGEPTAVKEGKEKSVIAKATILRSREQAAKAIPELLTLLEKDPCQKILWRFYRHFAALLSSDYGHRRGCFSKHYHAGGSGGPQIHLVEGQPHQCRSPQDEHGVRAAQIILTEEEFGWVQRFLRVKDQLPDRPTAKYLFFTSTQNPCKNLNKSMGLPGCPTFTDVRTCIARHVKFTHSNNDRVKLSKFMCHDTWTADKFYVTNLTPQQAMEHRRLFDASLQVYKLIDCIYVGQLPPYKQQKCFNRTQSGVRRHGANSDVISVRRSFERFRWRYQSVRLQQTLATHDKQITQYMTHKQDKRVWCTMYDRKYYNSRGLQCVKLSMGYRAACAPAPPTTEKQRGGEKQCGEYVCAVR
ncbi:unnamed protein product [Leuciscus chuanchicus]